MSEGNTTSRSDAAPLDSGKGDSAFVRSGKPSDARLVERAIRKRWPIPPEFREAVIAQLAAIVADPTSSRREKTSAARTLLTAEGQNQADEMALAPFENRLGDIEPVVIELPAKRPLLTDATKS